MEVRFFFLPPLEIPSKLPWHTDLVKSRSCKVTLVAGGPTGYEHIVDPLYDFPEKNSVSINQPLLNLDKLAFPNFGLNYKN